VHMNTYSIQNHLCYLNYMNVTRANPMAFQDLEEDMERNAEEDPPANQVTHKSGEKGRHGQLPPKRNGSRLSILGICIGDQAIEMPKRLGHLLDTQFHTRGSGRGNGSLREKKYILPQYQCYQTEQAGAW
jgi:hypothetical protein